MEYTVTPFQTGQDREVAELYASLISSGWRLSQSSLLWKYRENPFIRDPLVFLVRHGRKVVGMRGLFGTSWILGPEENPITLPHADDLVIHPDHRNRGLFLLLNRATADAARDRGFPALVSLSGGTVTQDLQELVGWKVLGDLHRLYREPPNSLKKRRSRRDTDGLGEAQPRRIRGRYRAEQILRGMGFSPGIVPRHGSVDRQLRQLGRPDTPHLVISRTPRLTEMAALAQAVGDPRLHAPRTEPFLRWRLKNPRGRYRFLYWHNSELRGFMVLAWHGTDIRRAVIADYAVESVTMLQAFLRFLARSRNMEFWLMGSTLPSEHEMCFLDAGFAPDPSMVKDQRRRFLVLPLGPSSNRVSEKLLSASFPEGWRVAFLDTMGV